MIQSRPSESGSDSDVTRSDAAVTDLRQACLDAALDAIRRHGIEALSLRDVARQLGVSHQAPYRHFGNRDGLLGHVIGQCFQRFAAFLDDRPTAEDVAEDLGTLGDRYLAYASAYPLEYRLMFGTPWPAGAAHDELALSARHAFDTLLRVLRRLHGAADEARTLVELDAMFIWSTMHGLASISHSAVAPHLNLASGVADAMKEHTMTCIAAALHRPNMAYRHDQPPPKRGD